MLETLVNLSSEGVWVLDENGNTDLINEPGAAILGFAPDEIIGKRPADIGFLGFDGDAQGVCEEQVGRREFRMRRR
ncbi:MAG TPA: PAS domain-containing protein, partial [Methanomassiliicoccaceae archaeon]|nr:PAS domain-containing protein [Methanomassiliicoccaceae archaeon]